MQIGQGDEAQTNHSTAVITQSTWTSLRQSSAVKQTSTAPNQETVPGLQAAVGPSASADPPTVEAGQDNHVSSTAQLSSDVNISAQGRADAAAEPVHRMQAADVNTSGMVDSAGAVAASTAAAVPLPDMIQPEHATSSSGSSMQQTAAAPPSQQGSHMRSSSGSAASRRSSRTRVGDAAPALASAAVPSHPAEQQLLQQQALPMAPAPAQRTNMLASQKGALAGPVQFSAACAGVQAAADVPNSTNATAAARQSDSSQPCGVVAPSYHRSTSSSVLSLHIHGTSQLVPDLLLTDPVIRLHVVNAATGEYVRIMQQLAGDPPAQAQQQQAAAAGRHSSSNSPSRLAGSSSSLPHARHPIGTDTQAELLEYPGRPALSTLDNNTANPKPGLLEYIPAVQTRPFSITSASSADSSNSADPTAGGTFDSSSGSGSTGGSNVGTRIGLSAAWEEELCVDAAPQKLMESDALLLLELLQLPGGFARYKRHAYDFGKAGAGHSIAWAFLRLSGLQRKQLMHGQPLKLKLQLYQYSPGALRPEGLLSPRLAVPHPVSPAKAAYLSFKLSGFLSPGSNSPSTAFAATDATTSTSSPVRSGSSALQPPQLQSAGAGSGAVAGSSSPWRVGLWSPWGSEGPGLVSPGVQSRLQHQGLAAGVSKYPAYVEVTLAAVPRPQGAVVVTDPAAGIRPALPTGYGSGFEIGRMPVSLLYMPRAMRGTRGSAGGLHSTAGSTGRQLSADDAFRGFADEAILLLESRLHRPHTHACQVPNALLAEVKGTPGGCSAISISRDGRWLAAACGDDKGRFKVALYQALTGRLCWVLGSHAGMVHSISWAKDDSAIITASADFTVKLWHLPELPGPPTGNPQSSLTRHYSGMQCQQFEGRSFSPNATAEQAAAGAERTAVSCPGSPTRMFATGRIAIGHCGGQHMLGSSAALGATAAAAGVSVSVLQHTCFVYAAELHPTQQPMPTVVTAGFDGVLRLWSLDGVVLYSLLVSEVPVNCIAFDQLGTRLFAGDAAGSLTEVSLDLTPLSAAAVSWSQSGWGAAAGTGSSHSSCSGQQHSNCGAPGSSSRDAAAPSSSGSCSGLSSSGGAALVASVLRHGSSATQQLAGAQLMRKLRVSQELGGCPIMSLMCHPGGHHLIALARSPKGVSDLVALDAKLLLVARRFTGIRCSNAPIKFGLSPDGQYVLCGSEDGSTTIWDFATATPTPVPHMALGHAPVHSMAWSSSFQAVVVCSFSHYAHIRVLGYAAEQPQVVLNPPSAAAQQQARNKASEAQALATADMHRPLRCPLPDQLTPAHVHALLSDLRLSASQRGLYSQSSDPNGQQLMVAAHPNKHLPRRLGSRPASSAGHAAAGSITTHTGLARSGSSNSSSGGSSAGALAAKQGSTAARFPGMLQVAGLDSGAAQDQQGIPQPHKLPGSLAVQVAAAGGLQKGQQQQGEGLIPEVVSQPTTPRVIDGTPRGGAAAVAAPWLN